MWPWPVLDETRRPMDFVRELVHAWKKPKQLPEPPENFFEDEKLQNELCWTARPAA